MKKLFIFTAIVLACQVSYAQWTTSGTNIYNSNSGNVGIGTSTPSKKFEVRGLGTTDEEPMKITNNDNTAALGLYCAGIGDFIAGYYSYRCRGTAQSPANVLANDRIGGIFGRAYINGDYRGSASVEMLVGASPGASSYASYIVFGTTATGSTARTEKMRITESGFVGIGKNNPAYLLDVNGAINATALYLGTATAPAGYKLAIGGKAVAEEVVIKLQANWPDYVFAPSYKLPSLSELEKFIIAHKHLPGVPTAGQVKDNGVAVGEMNAILLKKVEELTLYLIELKKENDQLKVKLDEIISKL